MFPFRGNVCIDKHACSNTLAGQQDLRTLFFLFFESLIFCIINVASLSENDKNMKCVENYVLIFKSTYTCMY